MVRQSSFPHIDTEPVHEEPVHEEPGQPKASFVLCHIIHSVLQLCCDTLCQTANSMWLLAYRHGVTG